MDLIIGACCLAAPVIVFVMWSVVWLWSRLRNRPADSFMIDRWSDDD